MYAINGMDATPKYVAKAVELSYHDMKYYLDFAVIADVSPRIVLGMDFINKAGVIIDSYRKTIILSAPTIHSEPIPKLGNTTQKKVRFDSTSKPKSILKPEKEKSLSHTERNKIKISKWTPTTGPNNRPPEQHFRLPYDDSIETGTVPFKWGVMKRHRFWR